MLVCILILVCHYHALCPVSFQIYDSDGDNYIDKAELRGLVTSTMREHDVIFSSDSISRIVDETFAEIRPANPSLGISFEE